MKFQGANIPLVFLIVFIFSISGASQDLERKAPNIIQSQIYERNEGRDEVNTKIDSDKKSNTTPCSFPSLLNGKSFSTGTNTYDVATGDVNNDGKQDVVTANFDANSLSVLIGDGLGDFLPSINIPTEARTRFVALKELNGDGNIDAIALTQTATTSKILILLGNGTGNFSISSQYLLNDPSDLKIVDVNNDGKYDLVVKAGDSAIGKVLVYPGNGDGTFGVSINTNLPQFSYGSIETGDFSGDGFVDFISSTSSGIFLWTGNGTGNFSQGWNSNQANGAAYKGNFNGDAFADLVIMNSTFRYVKIFTGNGNGTFTPLQRYTIGEVAVDVAVGDINHDGLDDIVTSNFASNEISVLINSGSATFTPMINYVASAQARGIVMNDFNGDGNQDVITTGWRSIMPSATGFVLLISGRGNGTFNAGINYPIFQDAFPNSVVVADLDMDGREDVVTGNSEQWGVSVLLRNGAYKFAIPRKYLAAKYINYVAVKDFNGDGKPDIVAVGDATGHVLLGDGTGNFSLATTFTVGPGGGFSIFVGSADFNSDGKPDLVVSDRDAGRFTTLMGNGDGTFSVPVEYFTGDHPKRIAIADFNHDSLPDLAIVVDSGGDSIFGRVQIRLNLGNGTFSGFTEYRIGVALHPTSVIANDLNADGNVDFAVIIMSDPSGEPELRIYQGDGFGNFSGPSRYSVDGVNPSDLMARDFNQDGMLDIAVVNNVSEDISIFGGVGGGSFNLRQKISAGEQARALTIGNLNSDSSPEIVVTNYNGSSFTIAPNICDQAPLYATVSGRVVMSSGRAVKNATISITDPDGSQRTLISGPSGYFSFANLVTDADYMITVNSRRFQFAPRTVRVNNNVVLPDFVGSP